MDFDQILDQAIEMLQRRGRLTYRTLKRQFGLDDETLEDLKFELIEGQQIATDEKKTVLVWTGTTISPPEPSPVPSAQLEAHTTQAPSDPRPSPSDAERRQLTVMFCDLVGSTHLSGQLDPEELRDVIRAYQAASNDIIQRYEGYVAQYLGDGLLVYLGYPMAHEDDAQRAVRAGLGIIDAMEALNQRLAQAHGVELAVRIGIHTGLVVIGDIGDGERQEQLALGETPNVAARIQGLAEPDTVVISNATYRLVEGYFECDTLGERALKGVDNPVNIYRVISSSGVQGRLEVARTRGLTPLVGREQEVNLLLKRWTQAKRGHGQVVLLSGEAGIGKSRLIQVLREHLAKEPHTRIEGRSSPYYENTALYPVVDLLQRTLRIQAADTPETRLQKLESALGQYQLPLGEAIPLVADLLSIPIPEGGYAPLNYTPQRQRQKTLETLLAIFLELAERQPLLFILEDLHWTDPTTLEFLGLVVDQVPVSSILLFLTTRPEFNAPWGSRSYLGYIMLNRLSPHQVGQMAVEAIGGKVLPDQLIERLVQQTDGVPLFIEEMTKAIVESGALKEIDGQFELVEPLTLTAIPATLQDSLMARLDRLVTAKAVAQCASVIGRQFSYELLREVVQLDEATLQRELSRLVEAELVYQRGLPPQAMYTFKHALVSDLAYQSLLRRTRIRYHRQIAKVLEDHFAAVVETQPELLAHHYTEAGLHEQAIPYWQQAGENAFHRSAFTEASMHLRRGLDEVHRLPKARKHDADELELLMGLIVALQAIKGMASVEFEEVLNQSYELCQQVGNTQQEIRILLGLRILNHVRGNLQTAWGIGQQLFDLINDSDEPELNLQIYFALGHTAYYLGMFDTSRVHLERGIQLYNTLTPRYVSTRLGLVEFQGSCYPPLAWALWQTGYPDQSCQCIQEGLSFINDQMNITGIEYLLSSAAIVYQFCGQSELAQEYIERALTITEEEGFQFRRAWNLVLKGWIIGHQGHVADGMELMSQGLAKYRMAGAQVSTPWFLALFAELHGRHDQTERGLALMDEAFDMMPEDGQRFYQAELYQLRGDLLLMQSGENATEAEASLTQALDIARHQQAKSLELRASTSLAKLWQSQGKKQGAYDLLAPVYNWFTEGFDTADLQDAQTLLDQLEVEG